METVIITEEKIPLSFATLEKEESYDILLIDALAGNKKIEKSVETLYNKNRVLAYSLATKSDYYNSHIFRNVGIRKEVNAKRLLGLYELSKKDEKVNNELWKIIKSHWLPVYRYIERKKDDEFVDFLEIDKFFPTNKAREDIRIVTMLTRRWAIDLNKKIVSNEKYYLFSKILETELNYLEEIVPVSFDETTRNKGRSLIKRIESKYGTLKDTFSIEVFSAKLAESSESFDSLVSYFFHIFESEDVDLFALTDEFKIKRHGKENGFEELATFYFDVFRNQNISPSSDLIFIGIILKALIQSLKNSKEFYFKNSNEVIFQEVEKKTHDLEEKNKEIDKKERENKKLRDEISKLKKENNKIKNKYRRGIEKDNVLLLSENKKLKKVIETMKLQEEQLNDIIFEDSKEEGNTETVNIKESDILLTFEERDIIVIGGNSNWQERISKKLPNTYTFIDGRDDSFDLQVLSKADIVIYNTKNISHSSYWRTKAYLRRKNIKYAHMVTSSIDIGLSKIDTIIKRFDEIDN